MIAQKLHTAEQRKYSLSHGVFLLCTYYILLFLLTALGGKKYPLTSYFDEIFVLIKNHLGGYSVDAELREPAKLLE